MTDQNQPIDPANVGRTAQIITAALMAGVLMFAGVAFFATTAQPAPMPVISLMGIGFAVVTLTMRAVVPSLMINAQKQSLVETAEPQLTQLLAALYQTRTIVGMALLEGAAFFNLLAYMIEKQYWSYGVVAFLLAVMAISFPSQGQFENWADDLKRNLR